MAKKGWMDRGADGLTFGERLEDLLAERGISQAKLAKETGIIQSAISGYISGKRINPADDTCREYRAPDCGSLIALANYFGVSTDYLLGLSKIKTSDNSIQATCNITGLSEKAIEWLRSTNYGPLDLPATLSFLMEQQSFVPFLLEIRKYLAACRAETIYQNLHDTIIPKNIDTFDLDTQGHIWRKFASEIKHIVNIHHYDAITSSYLLAYISIYAMEENPSDKLEDILTDEGALLPIDIREFLANKAFGVLLDESCENVIP